MFESRQFCTIHLGEHLFGVEVMRIQEVISYQAMTAVPLAPDVIGGLINLRGQIVTAIDLRVRLEMPPRPEGALPMNVVVQTAGGAVSLLVDEIGDVVEVEEAIFENPPETLSGVAKQLIRGVYKFEGALLLDLDIDATIDIDVADRAAA
jgi:purine-binding chemotaxis protein CheW